MDEKSTNPYMAFAEEFQKEHANPDKISVPNYAQESLSIQKPVERPVSFGDQALLGTAGAGVGLAFGPSIEKGLASVIPMKPEVKKQYFNPRGVSVEDSLENRRAYFDAQHDQDKGIRRRNDLAKKYPNYNPQANELEKTLAQKIGKSVSNIGGFMDHLAGPRLGGAVGLGGTALEGSEAYNRIKTGDYPGAAIAGFGALGNLASMIPAATLPTAAIKGAGGVASIVSPLALMAYDAYRNKKPD